MPDVLLVRAIGGDDRDAEALRARGLSVVEDPYLRVAACTDAAAAGRAQHVLDAITTSADWLVVTSQASLRALTEILGDDAVRASICAGVVRGMQTAAVGSATARALEALGVPNVLVPSTATAAALLETLSALPAGAVVAPQGSQAMKGLTSGLRERGWVVDEQVVYETATVRVRPPTADRLADGGFAAVVFRSPTALRAVAAYVSPFPENTLAVCGGPTTAAQARQLAIGTVVVSPEPTAEAVADTVHAYLTRE
jgi:uroporphyrinogen-III synthase